MARQISDEHRAKLVASIAIARSKKTPETGRKISAALKGRPSPNLGRKISEEHRQKVIDSWKDPERRRKARERFSGAGGTNWRGGTTEATARRLNTNTWHRLRQEVYARDEWTCQDCGIPTLSAKASRRDHKRRVQCHHIVPFIEGGTDELDNLVTLCQGCHVKRHSKAPAKE